MSSTNEDDTFTEALAREVVTHLGEGWSLDPATIGQGYFHVVMQGPGGARLQIGPDRRNAQRMQISSRYPGDKGSLSGIEKHEIGVGRGRGAQETARQITRRLLPVYLPDLERAQERVLKDAQNFAARLQTAERFRTVLPGSRFRESSRPFVSDVELEIAGPTSGTVSLDPDGQGGSLILHSVPADLLLRIAAVLARTA